MIPLWLSLIRMHKANGGYALSLPFLIGALRDPAGKVSKEREENVIDIKKLLVSIRDETPDESNIIVTVCDRLKSPVFSESSSFNNPPQTHTRIYKQDSGECRLYVAPYILPNNKNTIAEFSDALWLANKNLLSEGRFSYRQGVYANFNSKDFEVISKAKKKLKDDEA